MLSAEESPAKSPQNGLPSPLHSDDLASTSSSLNVEQDQQQSQHHQEDAESMSPDSPDASASDVHGEKGQAPSLPEKSSSQGPPPATPSATMSSIATPSVGSVDKEKEKDRESSLATTTLSMPFRKRARRKDDRSTSDGKYAASSTDQPSASSAASVKGPPAKKNRASLFTKISHIFASCVTTSHRTHVVDIDEGPSHAKSHQKDSEKPLHRDAEVTKEASSSREPSSSSSGEEISRAIVVVPRVSDVRLYYSHISFQL